MGAFYTALYRCLLFSTKWVPLFSAYPISYCLDLSTDNRSDQGKLFLFLDNFSHFIVDYLTSLADNKNMRKGNSPDPTITNK